MNIKYDSLIEKAKDYKLKWPEKFFENTHSFDEVAEMIALLLFKKILAECHPELDMAKVDKTSSLYDWNFDWFDQLELQAKLEELLDTTVFPKSKKDFEDLAIGEIFEEFSMVNQFIKAIKKIIIN